MSMVTPIAAAPPTATRNVARRRLAPPSAAPTRAQARQRHEGDDHRHDGRPAGAARYATSGRAPRAENATAEVDGRLHRPRRRDLREPQLVAGVGGQSVGLGELARDLLGQLWLQPP